VIHTDDWGFQHAPDSSDAPLGPLLALWPLVIIPFVPGLLAGSILLIALGGCMSILAVVMSVTALADLEAVRARPIALAERATRDRRCRTRPQSRPRQPTRHPPRRPRRRRQARCTGMRRHHEPMRPVSASATRHRRRRRRSRP
jgi:hypothetical protein